MCMMENQIDIERLIVEVELKPCLGNPVDEKYEDKNYKNVCMKMCENLAQLIVEEKFRKFLINLIDFPGKTSLSKFIKSLRNQEILEKFKQIFLRYLEKF